MWRIKEAPQYEIEKTPGAWVLWGPCDDLDEDCPCCGGEGTQILGASGINAIGAPNDHDMIRRVTGLSHWTPDRFQ